MTQSPDVPDVQVGLFPDGRTGGRTPREDQAPPEPPAPRKEPPQAEGSGRWWGAEPIGGRGQGWWEGLTSRVQGHRQAAFGERQQHGEQRHPGGRAHCHPAHRQPRDGEGRAPPGPAEPLPFYCTTSKVLLLKPQRKATSGLVGAGWSRRQVGRRSGGGGAILEGNLEAVPRWGPPTPALSC